MAQGKSTSAEDKAKVIKAKIENPDSSIRDIEEKTGINYRTTARILDKDLSQVVTKSERIAKIVDNDLKTIENMSKLAKIYSWTIVERAEIDRTSIAKGEILAANTITADSFKRHQLLTGEATERQEVKMVDVSKMTDEEIEQYMQSKLIKSKG